MIIENFKSMLNYFTKLSEINNKILNYNIIYQKIFFIL